MPECPQILRCDGCGQPAASDHIARRLQRLERATRFRPVHIHTLLLSGISPRPDDEFLYTLSRDPQGEALNLLQAVQRTPEGHNPESALAVFQRLGFFLTHVLECPLTGDIAPVDARPIIENHLSSTITRIRRSLKPKRVVLISADLIPVAEKLLQTDLGCPVVSASRGTFLASAIPTAAEREAFWATLVTSHAQTA
jgi:hypothetical protein